MTVIPDDARAVLDSSSLAHLATANPDGSVQVSCVWVRADGDEIVFASLGERAKIRNIRRDPRVTLSVEAPGGANTMGMHHYLVVHGEARVTEGGAPELLQELAYTYIGPGVTFPPVPDPPPGFVIRIAPHRFGGMGSWAPGP